MLFRSNGVAAINGFPSTTNRHGGSFWATGSGHGVIAVATGSGNAGRFINDLGTGQALYVAGNTSAAALRIVGGSGQQSISATTGITAPTFTGDLTGSASGSAATVTGAAQTAITSLGTLTELTIAGALTTRNIDADAAGTRTIGGTYYYAGISSAYHYGYSYLMWQDPTAAPNGFVYQTTTTRSMISMHLTHNLAANKYKLNLVPGTGTPPFMYINIGGKVCLLIEDTGESKEC